MKITFYVKITAGFAGLLTGAFLFLGSGNAFAATYNITPTSPCDLSDAITASDTDTVSGSCAAGDPTNTINLSSGTYTLSADLPVIGTNPLTVTGAGTGSTIIDGGNTYGVFNASSDVNISDLTITDAAGSNAFAILVEGSGANTISNVVIENNPDAGGIFDISSGSLVASQVAITNSVNNADGIVFFEASGTFELVNSTIDANSSTAFIDNNSSSSGEVSLINDTIANNATTGSDPGGIGDLYFTGSPATFNLENTVLDNNTNASGASNCEPAGVVITIFTTLALNSLGGNVSSDSTCSTFSNQTNDKNNVDPLLSALTTINGTLVQPITSASPAYRNGLVLGSLLVDQAGDTRPQCGFFDSGAYQLPETCSSPSSSSPASASPKAPDTGFGVYHQSMSTVIELMVLSLALLAGGLALRRYSRQ